MSPVNEHRLDAHIIIFTVGAMFIAVLWVIFTSFGQSDVPEDPFPCWDDEAYVQTGHGADCIPVDDLVVPAVAEGSVIYQPSD